jgi:BNR repeat-like domain
MKPHQTGIILPMALSVALLACTSCGTNKPPEQPQDKSISTAGLRDAASPAGADSAQPNLATGADGQTYLSWIETTDSGEPALKMSIRKDGAWSAAQTIAEGESLYVNYADFPSLLSLGNGLLAAHWMTFIPHSEGYKINIAFSHDEGKTWSKPVVPHRDATPTEHGFVSLTPAPGGLGAIWLDSRKVKGAEGSGDVAMMYTSVGADGKLGPEMQIDGRVCECCQPNAVRTGDNGMLAVYRDRSAEEIRDIAIVRFDGTKWSEPKNIYADNWKILGCPINGPAIAAHGNQVAVAWFTAPNDKPKMEMAFSSDGGNTFGAPVQVDDGNPIGRTGVVMLDSGNAIVSWLEKGDKDVQLRARQVDAGGMKHASLTVGTASSGTSGGFPRMERNGDTVYFAWTDVNAGKVRVSTLDVKQ